MTNDTKDTAQRATDIADGIVLRALEALTLFTHASPAESGDLELAKDCEDAQRVTVGMLMLIDMCVGALGHLACDHAHDVLAVTQAAAESTDNPDARRVGRWVMPQLMATLLPAIIAGKLPGVNAKPVGGSGSLADAVKEFSDSLRDLLKDLKPQDGDTPTSDNAAKPETSTVPPVLQEAMRRTHTTRGDKPPVS